jgi:hypothetical protein
MSLVVTESAKSDYQPTSMGLHQAVLVDVVDLGVLETPWGDKHKCTLVFETDEMDPEGIPLRVSKRYTLSLSEKSNLRQDLERWRGRKFEPKELKKGFDLETLLGLNATIYVAHRLTEERLFANIQTILPPAKGKDGKPTWKALMASLSYKRVMDRQAAAA